MSHTPTRRLVGPLTAVVWLFAAAALGQEAKPPAQPDPKAPPLVIPDHRKNPKEFLRLLEQNPQFFAQKKISGNTTWEQLTCVGFHPDTRELKATVQVKQPAGYGGDLCGPGSREYVRFYVKYGSVWEDVGAAAFAAHDIPNAPDCQNKPTKPLSYVVTRRFEPKADKCDHPVLPTVRAILSWNVPPPPNSPNWVPPYGNHLDAHIQIKPSNPIKFIPISLIDAKKLYLVKGEKPAVAAHRFGLPDLHPVLAEPALMPAKVQEWKKLDLDLAAAVNAIKLTAGDTTYEDMHCVGIDNTSFPERLVATLHVKKSSGYSGNLCQPGSKEYVAFWADWDDDCKWTYVGTAAVAVHDIPTIPGGGLYYSAAVPVDLTHFRRECDKPRIARVRAVLSWGVPPSTTNPDAVPHWGNRRDTHVQLNPGPQIPPGNPTPIIGILGGVPVSKIKASPAPPVDATTGMTLSDATFALNGFPVDASGRACPFGGRVVLQGPQYPGLKYRVQTRPVGGPAWSTVVTQLKVWNLEGTIQTTLSPDAAGLFTFASPTAANPHPNADGLLAWWDTAGDDLMEVRLQLANAGGTILPGVDTKRVRVSNTPAEVSVTITSSANCHKYKVGETLQGKFVARHEYFGSYAISLSPFAPPAGQLTPPTSNWTTPTSAAGETWSLNTAGMKPCGYVLTVSASDRVVYNSVTTGRTVYAAQPIGFCLDAK